MLLAAYPITEAHSKSFRSIMFSGWLTVKSSEDLAWDPQIQDHVICNPQESILDCEDPEFEGIEVLKMHNYTHYFECDKRLISDAYCWLNSQ